MSDSLGDRIKDYERRETGRSFLPMLPVYARIDGRSFSRLTDGMERPFDANFSEAMTRTAAALVEHSQARIAYTQSDEINLLWLAEEPKSEIFFRGKIQKMVSVLAAFATAAFTRALLDGPLAPFASRLPHFDARLFQLPSRSEAANAILWRELDATKNAVSMAARHYYPHDEVDGRTTGELQELLFRKGINFNDYPAGFKRGTFVRRAAALRELSEEELSGISPEHRPELGAAVRRYSVVRLPMPRFASVINREAVIFDGAAPEVAGDTG
jgi:tRNA(His) 5'-end guanylyltransferase